MVAVVPELGGVLSGKQSVLAKVLNQPRLPLGAILRSLLPS